MPAEVPEADAIEQRQSLTASGGAPDPSQHGWEASDADVWEQQRDAEIDDEDTPRSRRAGGHRRRPVPD